MKKTIAIEEIAMFLLALFGFYNLPYSWWLFLALLLVPDLSMIGYAINSKTGAILYNIAHHKALAIAIFIIGFYSKSSVVQLTGVILFAHSSMDRALGYGLKYFDAFNHTHLGIIGKNK
ncbi:DUF4260 domain-containing protein [Pedobacter punctiformis]|uniref:DUF4260 domain-containing protein n=1 Tax=Pedobacter punctiformis TaxID=3004097 RepID=A0ABT4L7X9_9SPHI|nr:DUF4260 domain-containing protein [Pedobacter sp. HCMS5-2]MCZ4244035.1 DUF4260 domain-containing protein [Pedobacter sp. HCMS5-2]